MIYNDPLVTVIVPSYNHEKHILKCIKSIFDQTYKNIELFVIDDGSKDNSANILSGLNTKNRFTLIIQKNKGLPKTLNFAISNLAKGKYIAICASDDYWMPSKIEKQVNFMESNLENAMCYGKAHAIDTKNNVIKIDLNKNLRGGHIFEELMLMKFHPPVNYLYKKDILINLGLFDENIHTEDYYMNLKIAELYPIGFIDNFISYYRVHSYSNALIVKQYISHRKSIEHFKHTPIFEKAMVCWHWRVLGIFPKYTNLKIRVLESFLLQIKYFYRLHYIKAIIKLIFFWKKYEGNVR